MVISSRLAAMAGRWLIVLVTAAALLGTPLLVGARPAADSSVTASDLAARIEASGDVGWSGFVSTSGTLQVPDEDSFANLAELLGERTDLRVWWHSATQWRVDRIRSTGETNLFRNGDLVVRWVFESRRAVLSPVSTIRLPDASDLLPPTLGRALLQGARSGELARLPVRRVAGVDAPGLRLVPAEAATTVDHVDLWADPATGLPLRVELYGAGDRRPVLTTVLRDFVPGDSPAGVTRFVPPRGIELAYEDAVDVAAAANAFAPYDLPASLGGLTARTAADPGAVGVYGRGPTTMFVLPLRGRVAGPLRDRISDSAAVQQTSAGPLLPVGPMTLLVTADRGRGGGFLLAGTVTPETLLRAAGDLRSLP